MSARARVYVCVREIVVRSGCCACVRPRCVCVCVHCVRAVHVRSVCVLSMSAVFVRGACCVWCVCVCVCECAWRVLMVSGVHVCVVCV